MDRLINTIIFIGHNRTQSLAAQQQAARDQVARKLKIYNEKIRAGPVFGKHIYCIANC